MTDETSKEEKMSFTKAHAKIAADMLSDSARGLLILMKRETVMGMSSGARELQDLGFITEVNGLWQITSMGKKVTEVL
jgi:hypothetical protein